MTLSRGRLAAIAALVGAVVVAIALLAGGSDESASMAWKGKVQVFESGRPTDKILYAQVANTGLEDLDIRADDVKVFDDEGHEVFSAMRFLAAFAHGIYSWSDPGKDDFERRRLGEIVTLKPGQAAPVTLSWRVRKGERQPVRVDFGAAEIAIPRR